MENLIDIKENNGRHLVSARELYIGLGYDEKHYSRWCKTNIEDNPFFKIEEDWTPLSTMESALGGHVARDFAITIDFAKHLSMMAKTEIGKRYRDYFINVEKNMLSNSLPSNYIESLKALIKSEEEKQVINSHRLLAEETAERLAAKVKKVEKDNDELSQKVNELINNFTFGLSIKDTCKMFNGVSLNEVLKTLENKKIIKYTNKHYTEGKCHVILSGWDIGARGTNMFKYGVWRAKKPMQSWDKGVSNKYGEIFKDTITLTVTKEGIRKLYNMYKKGVFKMRKTWDGKHYFDMPIHKELPMLINK